MSWLHYWKALRKLRNLFIKPVSPELHHLATSVEIGGMIVHRPGSSADVRQLHLDSVAIPVLLIQHRAELVPHTVAAGLSCVSYAPYHPEHGIFTNRLLPVTAPRETQLVLAGNFLQKTE